MTIPDQEAQELAGLAAGRAVPRFQVGFERLEQLDRSPVHLIADRLPASSPSRDIPAAEMPGPAALVQEVAEHHGDDSEFIRSDMPIQEIVFRTLIAGNNRPISLTGLHYELTERWATPIRPIAISERRLLRILDADTYYGFVRVTEAPSGGE